MKILWIEDFGGRSAPSKIAAEVFKGLLDQINLGRLLKQGKANIAGQLADLFREHSLHEVFVCTSYVEWKKTYEHEKGDFDIALIDINLSESSRTPIDELPEGIDNQDFDRGAGFHIYHQLIKKGFPDDNIAFFTGEAQSLAEFSTYCGEIFLELPGHCFEKNPLYFEQLRRWLSEKSQQETLILRRGVLEGCRFMKEKIQGISSSELETYLTFYKTVPSNVDSDLEVLRRDSLDYLIRLERLFLVRHNPDGADLVDLLKEIAAKWEESRGYFMRAKKAPRFGSWLEEQFHKTSHFQMKMLRNWSSHRLLSPDLTAKEIAYFFMLAMRSWVESDLNEIVRYERILSTLFSNLPAPELNRLVNSVLGFKLEKSYEQLRTLHKDVLRLTREPYGEKRSAIGGNRRIDNYFLGLFRELGEVLNWLEQFEQAEPSVLAFYRRRIREASPQLFYQTFWHGLFPLQIRTTFYADLQSVKFYIEPLPDSFISFIAQATFEESFKEERASVHVA